MAVYVIFEAVNGYIRQNYGKVRVIVSLDLGDCLGYIRGTYRLQKDVHDGRIERGNDTELHVALDQPIYGNIDNDQANYSNN